jgi:hypothetical protein
MSAEDAGTGEGAHGEQPSEEELAREEAARSAVTVAELVERDLDDPSTPSRRGLDGRPVPGSFDVPMEEPSRERSDGR